MNRKILITGIAGFVGFHLAQKLQEIGDEVIGLDNFNDYYSPKLKKDRAAILEKKGMKIHNLDICDQKGLEELFRKGNFTHVVNLAAQVGVRNSVTNPQVYIKTNLEGFGNILEMVRHHGKPSLIYASSSSVFGTNKKIPFSIEDKTDSPASLYGATKKANELMAYSYHSMYGLNVTGLRFFTVYGPWGRPDMAIYSFTKAISEGRAIDIYNQGNMQRDFTYIDDIINGTVASIDLSAPYEVFNLGNHRKENLTSLVEYIENSLGKKAKKNFLAMQIGDVEVTYADIEHSQEKLGYIPKTTLQDGIAKFVEWYTSYES